MRCAFPRKNRSGRRIYSNATGLARKDNIARSNTTPIANVFTIRISDPSTWSRDLKRKAMRRSKDIARKRIAKTIKLPKRWLNQRR